MSAATFYVRITRDDGSVTYKGAMRGQCARREASAWRSEFPTYRVEVLPADAETRAAMMVWQRATVTGARYYPPM